MGGFRILGDELDYLFDLRPCDSPVPLDDLIDGCTFREALEDDGDGQPGIADCGSDSTIEHRDQSTIRCLWRKLVGVEPTCDAVKRRTPDLKSGPSTGQD